MFIRKQYLLNRLLDGKRQVKERIALIEKVSQAFDFITETYFELSPPNLIYYQEKLKRNRIHDLTHSQRLFYLEKLSHDLDTLSQTGFIHGDINKKNIIFSNNRLYIVDLEPSLAQIRNGIRVLMYTPPYISINDYINKTISLETDKIGFYFLLHSLLYPHSKEVAFLKKVKIELNPVLHNAYYYSNLLRPISFQEIYYYYSVIYF